MKPSWRRTIIAQTVPDSLELSLDLQPSMAEMMFDSVEDDNEPQLEDLWDKDARRPWTNVTLGWVMDRIEDMWNQSVQREAVIELRNSLFLDDSEDFSDKV